MNIQLDTLKIGNAAKYWEDTTSVEMAMMEEAGELLAAMSKYERHKEEQKTLRTLKKKFVIIS